MSQARRLQVGIVALVVVYVFFNSHGSRFRFASEDNSLLGGLPDKHVDTTVWSSHPSNAIAPRTLLNAWPCYDHRNEKASMIEPDPVNEPYIFGVDNHPDTVRAQTFIYRHQHPPNCKDLNMRFFVWNMKDFGLGSDLHTLGYALAIAIKQNRVLVLGPDWRYNSQSDELCKDAKSLNCFAAPISNCTLDDVGPYDKRKADKYWQRLRVVSNSKGRGGFKEMAHALNKKHAPPPFTTNAANVTWWRAQALRYTLRRPACFVVDQVNEQLRRMFPETHTMPTDAISVHVRHGDKYKEMALHPLSEYMALAREIKAGHPSATTIFLSTEDPDVIEESKKITDFRIVYTDFGRFNRILGGDEGTLHDFVNLYLAALCRHAVSTHASNWNRMIFELQKTTDRFSGEYKPLNQPECQPDISACDW